MRLSLLVFLAVALDGAAAFFVAPMGITGASSTVARGKGRMYMLFGGSDKKKKDEEAGGASKPASKMNPLDAMTKLNELASKTNNLTKDLTGTFVSASALDGKVTVTFTGTQVPMEVKVTEDALGVGAAKLSAALLEAMKESHTKSMQLQQAKLQEFYESMGLGAAMRDLQKSKEMPK